MVPSLSPYCVQAAAGNWDMPDTSQRPQVRRRIVLVFPSVQLGFPLLTLLLMLHCHLPAALLLYLVWHPPALCRRYLDLDTHARQPSPDRLCWFPLCFTHVQRLADSLLEFPDLQEAAELAKVCWGLKCLCSGKGGNGCTVQAGLLASRLAGKWPDCAAQHTPNCPNLALTHNCHSTGEAGRGQGARRAPAV